MVRLTYGSLAQHNAQILTGFNILFKGKCQIADTADEKIPPNIVIADVDGKKIAYDTCDGYYQTGGMAFDTRYKTLSNEIDVLYKRDFSPNINSESLLYRGEMYPLGLNYFCYDRRIKGMFYPGYRALKKQLKEILFGDFDANWKNFEANQTNEKHTCDVLFLTRLWNPNAPEVENSEVSEERRKINEMRISIIRELRKKYGDKAVCGVNDDSYSKEIAPDLIVPSVTQKKNYIQMMKGAKVAIASLGLHKSNGWKTGEYISAGRAVVMEKPYYDIPFAEKNQNWLEYISAEECLEAVDALLTDEKRRKCMQVANYQYYCCHLRPDKLIQDTLK